jgi:hypothetical protein
VIVGGNILANPLGSQNGAAMIGVYTGLGVAVLALISAVSVALINKHGIRELEAQNGRIAALEAHQSDDAS